MVVAADDVGDLHQRVVDGDHVVVDRDATKAGANLENREAARAAHGRADQDGVRDRLGGKLDLAADQIVEAQRLRADLEPDGEGPARGQVFLDLLRRQSPAAAGVDLRTVLGGGQFALGFQLLRGAEAAVGLALGQQALGVLSVDLQPFGLAIGAEIALFFALFSLGKPARPARTGGAFVPVQAQPAQILDELSLIACLGAFQVGVLDAEDELAAVATGKEPVVERGAGIAHMKQASGRRSKADAGSGSGHSFDDRR